MNNFLTSSAKALLIRLSRRWQRASGVRNLELWGLSVNRRGHLAVQGLDTVEMVAQYGSPLMVVNKQRLTADVLELQNAFKRAPTGSKILYSYKTNCIPGILKVLHASEIGAEVISPYELWLAKQLNVSGDMILYNGVDKSDESLESAVDLGVLAINIDHVEEVERISAIAARLNKKANVGIRLSLSNSSQFGLDVESGEALDVCKSIVLRSKQLNLSCVHVHMTSNAKNANSHKEFAKKALGFMRQVKDATGLAIPYLDMGGGFGVPTTKNMSGVEYGLYRTFGVLPKPPAASDAQPLAQLMDELICCIEENCRKLVLEMPRLVIEPGRLITSRAEFLLSSVRTIKQKQDGPTYAITDAGRLSVTFPCDFEYHEVFVAGRPNAAMDTLYEVKGRVCTSADWMFKNRLLPKLQVGDVLAVMDAGAYFSSYSSNFAFPRPLILMVDDNRVSTLRDEETFEHLIAMDSF